MSERLYQVDVWQPLGEKKTHSLILSAKSGYHAKLAAIEKLRLDREAIDRYDIVLVMTEVESTHDDPLRERHNRCSALVPQLFGEDATLQWGAHGADDDGYIDGYIVARGDDEVILRIPPHRRALDGLEALLEILAEPPREADGSDGHSARPRTLQSCWEVIEMMDVEVKGAMADAARYRRALMDVGEGLTELIDQVSRGAPGRALMETARSIAVNITKARS